MVTKNGLLDTIITEEYRIFIIEYKYNVNSSVALQQVNDREYYGRYLDAKIPVLLFGVSLVQKKTRNVDISYEIKYDEK